jgi:hypothetical protein
MLVQEQLVLGLLLKVQLLLLLWVEHELLFQYQEFQTTACSGSFLLGKSFTI